MLPTILLYIVIFLYGIVIGSFLNVLIYRIPKKENIVTTRSHCMNCGYQLKWYDLVPLFSYLVLGGRCRKCKAHISVQYPVIEALNGVLYLIVFWKYGMSVDSLVYCLLFSTLLALSVIDFRTYEIPVGFNLFILGCIIGSVIHLIRMKVSGEGHVLAMGPYLSAGVAIAVLWGNEFLQWYLHFYL